jgi:hypothetical protein
MPLRHIDEADIDYYPVLFDSVGNERPELDVSLLSTALCEATRDEVTDVFFTSHGWKDRDSTGRGGSAPALLPGVWRSAGA